MTEQEERDKKRRDREISDLNFVLNSPEGRRVVWRILDKAKTFSSPFSFSNGERNWTDFYCGMQDVGMWLWRETEFARPDALSVIRREQQSREKMDEMDIKKDIEDKTPLTRP